MTVLETLKVARAKIADRKHWTQGAYARNDKDMPVEPLAEDACQWCAVGALYAISTKTETLRIAWDVLAGHVMGKRLPQYNDWHSHREVLALYDKAIASLES